MINNFALRKAFGSCRSDIVGIENLEHVCSGITHKRAHADNDKRDYGQYKVIGFVKELSGGVQHGIVTAYQTSQLKPTQFYCKYQL